MFLEMSFALTLAKPSNVYVVCHPKRPDAIKRALNSVK